MKTTMDKHWKWIFLVYLFVLLFISFGGALTMSGQNNWERGVYWVTPVDGRTYGTEILLNGRVYCKEEIQSAELIFNDGQVFPIERTSIYHDGEALFTTTIFINDITVEPGMYDVKAKIVTENDTYVFDTISLTVDASVADNTFVMFSKQHLWACLAVIAGFFVLLGAYYIKPNIDNRTIIYIITSVLVLGSDLVNRVVDVHNGGFNMAQNLPFHMCDISAAVAFVLFFMKKGKKREIIYNLMFIWGVAGAIMALLTPDLPGDAVISVKFFNFFIRHGSIAISVLLVTFIEGYRPKIKLLPQIIGITTVMALLVYGIDRLMVIFPPYDFGNYMFLVFPPLGGSPIDLVESIFGPSPYYIAGLVLLAVVVYLAFWLPFAIEGLVRKIIGKPIEN